MSVGLYLTWARNGGYREAGLQPSILIWTHKSSWSYVVSVISMCLEPLKMNLAGKRLATGTEVKQSATWLLNLAADFLNAGIQTFVTWWDRCFNMNGRSVEVWCVPCAIHVTCARRSRINISGVRRLLPYFTNFSIILNLKSSECLLQRLSIAVTIYFCGC